MWIYGTALGDGSRALDEVRFAFPAAIVLGSEGEGLRHLTKKLCDELVEIPLPGRMQSLNVNQAASVLLYETRRQFQAAAGKRTLREQNGKHSKGRKEQV